ncbi:MAG: hypothetical protein ACLGG0_04095 [Bacteriovoracia bacterium]
MKHNPTLDSLTEDQFLHGRKGPWPQPQPAHPLGEAPGVVHVPLNEWIDWWLHIGSRYVLTLGLTPIEYLRSIIQPGLAPVDDQEFARLLSHSMISKFITDKFDTHDQDIFKSFDLAGKYLIDLEAIRVVKPFKGMFASGTKVLLLRNGFDYTPEAIWVDKTQTLLTPENSEAWNLAKYFVLQGCAMAATLVVHPLIHFPLDSVNAVTKTALPVWHPLALRDLLVEGFKGIKGNLSYPPYCFPLTPPPVPSSYGEFQNAYWPAFLKFARSMLHDVKSDDQLVHSWGKFLSPLLPGFPADFSDLETLYQTAASYLWQVTVGHSVDHYNYGKMDVRKVPLRMRQEPPNKDDKIHSREKLVRFWDSGKYRMAQRLFFRPTTVTTLIGSEYRCMNERERDAVKLFRSELRAIDIEVKKRGICYIPLEEIAASIQY